MRNSICTSAALLDAPFSTELSASRTPTKFLKIGERLAANTVEIESVAGASDGDFTSTLDKARSNPGQFGSPVSALTDALYRDARRRRAVVVGDMIVHAYRVVRRFASR